MGLLGILGGAVLALVGGSTLATTGLSALGRRHVHLSSDLATLVVGAAGDLAALGVVVLLLRELRPRHAGLRPIGLAAGGIPVAVAGGAAALFVVFPLVLLASRAVEAAYRLLHAKTKPHPVLEMMGADHNWAVTALGILTAVVIAPLAEEAVFRGVMQTMLAQLFTWGGEQLGLTASADPWPDTVAVPVPPGDGPAVLAPLMPWRRTPAAARWAAVIVTSVLFAAVHANVAFLLPLFVLSLGLGFVYERSGNLWMNTATHALFNAAQLVLFLAVGKG